MEDRPIRIAGTLNLDGSELVLDQGGNATTITSNAPAADISITLPVTTDTLLGRATTDTLTNKTISGSSNTLSNIAYASLALSAGDIPYSKLTLTGSLVNADVSATAAIAYSKLSLTDSVVNADIATAAGIAYSKLSLTSSLVNADVSAAAAIALNKLAATTGSRALVSDGSGVISASAITTTELGYVSGVTSDIQTQLAGKEATITAGTTSQYLKGDKSLGTLATDVAATAAVTANTAKVSADGSIGTHSDVDVTTAAPVTNNTLVFDGTNWVPGTGGSGSGSKNYVTNPSASGDTTGWVSSTGLGLSRTTTTANLPRETTTPNAFALTLSADGDYARYRFTLDDADQNAANLLLKLAAKVADSGAWKLEVYENTASDYSGTYTEIPLTGDDSSGDTLLPATTSDFTTFWTPKTNAYIEFRLVHVGAVSNTIYYSDVLGGPGVASAVTPVGPWTTFTPGYINLAGATVLEAQWRQNAENMDIRLSLQHDGVNSGTGIVCLVVPESKTIANNAVGRGATTYYGQGVFEDAGVRKPLDVTYNTSTSVRFRYAQNSSGTSVDTINLSAEWSGGTDYLSCTASIPIAEWAGAANYAGNNDVEYASNSDASDADDTTNFFNGVAGSSFPFSALTTQRQKRIRFASPKQATDSMVFEVSPSGNVDDFRPVSGDWIANAAATVTAFTSTTGAGFIERVSATEFDVFFAQYRAGTSDWNASTGVAKWRVVKTRAGVAQGFGQATSTQPGLVKKNKWQVKTLADDVSSAGDMITFNNLVVGNVYRLTASIHSDSAFIADLKHDGNILDRRRQGTATQTFKSEAVFVATATTATITYVSGTVRGNAGQAETWAAIEELQNYETETTDFT